MLWRKPETSTIAKLFGRDSTVLERSVEDRVAVLERQVAQLALAEHDHCLGCGAMTPEYGQVECGHVDCRRYA